MTVCEQSGMKSINVKMLLGHDIRVSGHYYRPAESDILEDYVSHAADALTISPEHRLETKVQQLESQQAEEIERLKAQLLGYKEKQTRAQDISMESIRELRRRLDATEDKHEKALLALEHTRKFLIHQSQKEKYKHEHEKSTEAYDSAV
jgi:hypothetical protein